MKIKHLVLLCSIIGMNCFWGCSLSKKTTANQNQVASTISWTFLQLNDVYEISPLENGKVGGLARVATIRQELLKENPNTFTIMSGDFLSPSVIGTLKYQGEGIKGKQMVESLNAMGLDYACFGNHEFDIDYPDLQKRLNESNFTWLSANANFKEGEYNRPFFKKKADGSEVAIPKYKILTLKNQKNQTVNIGLVGLVLDANKQNYVTYEAPLEQAKIYANDSLKNKADVLVYVSHLTIADDKLMASENPNIDLIMGGHEHNSMRYKIGKTLITKADANAKTAWVHRCTYNWDNKILDIKSELIKIDDKIPSEKNTQAVVQKWKARADSVFQVSGFNPDEIVTELDYILDGTEATNRLQQSQLGNLIAQSMAKVAKKPVECAFFNSGSIRVDDQLQGKLTQVDVVRILPFGGGLVELDIKGSELKKVLTAGLLNRGRGGYLQWHNIEYIDQTKSFKINGLDLNEDKYYHVITAEFLLTGRERNLDFFTEKNAFIQNIDKPKKQDLSDLRTDVRRAFIAFMKK